MVPELSRSADHLCQGEEQQNAENNNSSNANIATGSGDGGNNQYYYKGSHLKTPDYINRGYAQKMKYIWKSAHLNKIII